nr:MULTISPECIES: toll/interleukin-1 receptor domain-containing protein [Protofrankia]
MVDERPAGLPVIFISYTQVDRAWAEWIAWQLTETGYDVHLQAWHLMPGTNWAAWMQRMTDEADHTLVVL